MPFFVEVVFQILRVLFETELNIPDVYLQNKLIGHQLGLISEGRTRVYSLKRINFFVQLGVMLQKRIELRLLYPGRVANLLL